MDWFLTDRWETPPAFEGLYSERLLRMPDGYVCYSPPPHAPDVHPPPILRNGFTTLRLETGTEQPEAVALYESLGYRRIPAFGEYASDPYSICYEKGLSPKKHSE